jgi:hypothetical protein
MRSILLSLGIVLFFIGPVLFVTGYRRRRGQGLCCSKCGYELAGLLDGDKLLTDLCPECGTPLHRLGATVHGWGKSRRLMLLGIACLILVVPSCGAWWMMGSPGLNKSKPVWWLQGEALFGSGVMAEEAAKELVSRVNATKTLPETLNPLASKALQLFDPSKTSTGPGRSASPWNEIVALKYASTGEDLPEELSTLICEKFILNANESTTWKRLATQSIGGTISGRIHPLNTLPATNSGFGVVSTHMLVGAEVDGQPWEIVPTDRHMIRIDTASGRCTTSSSGCPSDWTLPKDGELAYRMLEPGEHVARLYWKILIWVGPKVATDSRVNYSIPNIPPDEIRDITTTLTIRVARSPGDLMSLIDRRSAPDKAPIIGWGDSGEDGDSAWSVTHVKRLADGRVQTRIQGHFQRYSPDEFHSSHKLLAFAGRVSLRVGDQLMPLLKSHASSEQTDVYFQGGVTGNTMFYAVVYDLPRVKTVDVVIEPDPVRALTLGFDTMWNETVEVLDVPLDWSAVDEDADKNDSSD